MPVPDTILELVGRFDDNRAAYRSGAYNETQAAPRVHRPVLRGPGLGHGQQAGLRRSLQGRDPRGRHQDRRGDQGAGLLLPHRRRAQVLRRSQEALRQHQGRHQPGLPAAPLRLVRQAAALHPHRLRGVRRLRLPRQARQERQGLHRPRPVFSPTRITPTSGTRSPPSSRAKPSSKARSTGTPRAAKGKHGTAEVDDAFLAEIERWRDLLARNIALRNPQLSQRELNYAVQMTIDRIIFLRICEDRGIEPYGQLQGSAPTAATSTRACASSSARPTSATTPACSTFATKKSSPKRPTR